ncbi:hypothetical protein EYV94_23035 [Puteibacter caeruleilacunae]|nr:hypothetical protein EYV94_23035 [Puteibacter caeruleilacunae]
MELLLKHVWILLILVTVVNALVLKFQSKKYIQERPDLKDGYDKFFLGFLVYGNIPWLIIMVGSLSGITESVFEYLTPRLLNPVVLLFHLSVIVLWALSIRWVYFKKGAEFIEQHPGIFQRKGFNGTKDITAKQVKLILPFLIIGGLAAMVMMWTLEVYAV